MSGGQRAAQLCSPPLYNIIKHVRSPTRPHEQRPDWTGIKYISILDRLRLVRPQAGRVSRTALMLLSARAVSVFVHPLRGNPNPNNPSYPFLCPPVGRQTVRRTCRAPSLAHADWKTHQRHPAVSPTWSPELLVYGKRQFLGFFPASSRFPSRTSSSFNTHCATLLLYDQPYSTN